MAFLVIVPLVSHLFIVEYLFNYKVFPCFIYHSARFFGFLTTFVVLNAASKLHMRKIKLSGEILTILIGCVLLAASLILHLADVSEPMLWSTIPLYTALLSLSALLISGWEVYLTAIKRILRRDLLDEAFLMSIASIAAFCIGEYVEGVAVILFYRIGEYFEHKAVRRSRQAIRALMDICADTAILLKDGEEIEVDADEVEVGDTILLRPGDRVPCDAIILDGSASLDTSALTGESLPRDVVAGDSLLSGCIVQDARLIARVTKPSEESSAARVLAMVEEANERKSRQERLIASFSRIYTPIVVALAVLIAFIPPLLIGFTLPVFTIWLRRALMLLVVSCPCALVISVPLAFFGGIGNAAARGILFKGGSTFDALANAKIAVFDKTGTLTSGAFVVSDVKSCGVSEAELLYLSASAESASTHPTALAIRDASQASEAPTAVRELAGKGVIATLTRGEVAVGNLRLMQEVGASVPDGFAGIYVALDGNFIGSITLSDQVKEGAKEAISRLSVRYTVMLTGDNESAAKAVADAVGIDQVCAGLLPQEKYQHLEQLLAEGTVIYVGDGINDAPCLARADVGVAMGGIGSDAAIEAADVVLLNDDPRKLITAMGIARKTLSIARFNMIFALGIKIGVMLLAALGLLDFSGGMWLAVFADVGVALLAILNSLRMIFFKK